MPDRDAPRVLAISNLYPPHHLGGYELVHAGADRALAEAGCAVRVLVSDHRRPGVAEPDPAGPVVVDRALPWYWHDHRFPALGPRATVALERRAHAALRRALADHRPDVVVLWAMGGLSQSLIGALERTGVPLASVVHDLWPLYGRRVDPFARTVGRLGPLAGPVARALGSAPPPRPAIPAGPVLLNSHRLGQELLGAAGAPLPAAWRVVPPGVAVPADPLPERPWRGRLLCLGRLDERKGIDVAVAALAHRPGDRLTIAGDGDPRVARELRAQAERLGVAGRVDLRGPVAHDRLGALLDEHDALLFPVRWSEPFGLVPLEAMAHGRPVVATGGGGQDEYLRDGANALVVPHEDPVALAAAVGRLAGDEALRRRLRDAGRRTAAGLREEDFRATVVEVVRGVAGR